jgi:tRNA A37 threonylcarbamoyladenosine synthetase subunit TsaC/SUA5/YrdC
MIINNNRDAIADLKKIRARRKARPMTYMEKQYARAEEKANKIKNHNEKLLKQMKEK